MRAARRYGLVLGVLLSTVGCSGAGLRGAEFADGSATTTPVAEFENVGCVDREGAAAPLPRLRMLLEQRAKVWVLRVVRPDGVAFVITNRWEHGDETVFQAIVERRTEPPLLFDFRLRDVRRLGRRSSAVGASERAERAASAPWAGRMAIAHRFGESQAGDQFRALIPDAPVACWLRATAPSPLSSERAGETGGRAHG